MDYFEVWYSCIMSINAKKKMELLNKFGNEKNIYTAKVEDLKETSLLTENQLKAIKDESIYKKTEEVLKIIEKESILMVKFDDELYPNKLKEIYDPPTSLYYKGNINKKSELVISVVGSRKASSYGLEQAYKISKELAKNGVTIVSGMASGIDSMAHRAALDANNITYGILGCGVDVIYPYENRKLYEEVIEKGAIISEFPPTTKPFKYNFPIRNRIISGMSDGVVVIEASNKSGSLISVNFALEQGRDVFSVPGNIDSFNSIGANLLIKDGAIMVTSVEDILNEYTKFNLSKRKLKEFGEYNENNYQNLSENEKSIIKLLFIEPLDIENIRIKSLLDIGLLNSTLTILELKGEITQLPGKVYKLVNK